MIIILAMLFLGVLIVILTIVIGFEEDPGREIPDDADDQEEQLEDMGGNPWVLDIETATVANRNCRNARWSGEYM